MKVGTENSKKTIAAVVLFVIAMFLVGRMIIGDTSSSASAAPATPPTPTLESARVARRVGGPRTGRTVAKQATTEPTNSLDPRLHLDLLKETESTEYKGDGRNIFMAQANDVVIPKVVAPGLTKPQPVIAQGPVTPPPPPPPPRIELKFFGFASSSGNKKVFLSHGEDVFVAAEGDIVNRRYKVIKINANNVEILDVLNNNTQTIPLSAG